MPVEFVWFLVVLMGNLAFWDWFFFETPEEL